MQNWMLITFKTIVQKGIGLYKNNMDKYEIDED